MGRARPHPRGRWGPLALLALLALAFALYLGPAPEAAHASGEGTEVRKIAKKLQCPVCEGQSVADSASPVAAGMRQKILEMLNEGKSEQEIIAFFRGVYGDFVLRDPPKTGLASALWWGPGVAILAGLGLVGHLVLRRRRARAALAEGPSLTTTLGLSEEEVAYYQERLREELEERGA